MPSRWSCPKRQALFPFAIGAESSAISHPKRSVNESRKFCCTVNMKSLILNNWRAKLISLLLTTTLWYLIKKNVATTPSPSERPSQTPATERRSLVTQIQMPLHRQLGMSKLSFCLFLLLGHQGFSKNEEMRDYFKGLQIG